MGASANAVPQHFARQSHERFEQAEGFATCRTGKVPALPNDYGGRIPRQPALPDGRALDAEGIKVWTKRQRRRAKTRLSDVELRVIAAVVSPGVDLARARCDLTIESIRAKAKCSRRGVFDALDHLEALGLFEPREREQRGRFRHCTHTILKGWRGFHACLRLRKAQALAAGREHASGVYGCAAHHGRVVIQFRSAIRTAEAIEKALENEPIQTRRSRRYCTPTGAPYCTRPSKRYCTSHSGQGSDPLTFSSSPDPLTPPRARARSAHGEKSVSPTARRGSAPASRPQSQEVDRDAAAETPRTRERASERAPRAVSSEPAFDGFAAPPQPQNETESTEGGRARTGPPPEVARDVERILETHRATCGRTTLARSPATWHERAMVAEMLATGEPADEIVEAVRGLPLLAHQHGRSVAVWARNAPMRQHAIEAWRAHVAELERVRSERLEAEARAAAKDFEREDGGGGGCGLGVVVRTAAYAIDHHKIEIGQRKMRLSMAWIEATGNPERQRSIAVEYRATFGEELGE